MPLLRRSVATAAPAAAASRAIRAAIARTGTSAHFDSRVAADQVVDRGGMDIDAGDRTAFEAAGDRPLRQVRSAAVAQPSVPRREALRGQAAIFLIQDRSDDHDLAGKFAPEIVLLALAGAQTQVGEGIGRNVVGAAVEIERHRVRHVARDPVAGERDRAVRTDVGLQPRAHATPVRAPCPAWSCRRRGRSAARRRTTSSLVGIDVQRPDILLLADGDALAVRGTDRLVAAKHLAEHHLAGGGARRQRAQEIAIEAANLVAERAVAERNLRLLDRVVETPCRSRRPWRRRPASRSGRVRSLRSR